MQPLHKKVAGALELIKEHQEQQPVVMSSFGKDSMVLLDLARRALGTFPVVFYREPFFPEKYRFANAVIDMWGLTVYDYPTLGTKVLKVGDQYEVANFMQVGKEPSTYLWIPTGVVPPQTGKPFLCGLLDLVQKPTGTFAFPWKTLLIGHKSADVDPLHGPLKLKAQVIEGSPKLVFPLEAFTDEDIWDYTVAAKLPIHATRYNEADNWAEHEDKTYNQDYFPTCMACLDKDGPDTVYCPKLAQEVKMCKDEALYDTAAFPQCVDGAVKGGK